MEQKTRSYQEYLIETLTDSTEAAAYLWAILQEEDPEPELLPSALRDVGEALGKTQMSPEELQLHLRKIEELSAKQGSEAIYSLADWLQGFGLQLTVTVNDEKKQNNSQEWAEETTKLGV